MNAIHLLLMMTDLEPRQGASLSSGAQAEPPKSDKAGPGLDRRVATTASAKPQRLRKHRPANA